MHQSRSEVTDKELDCVLYLPPDVNSTRMKRKSMMFYASFLSGRKRQGSLRWIRKPIPETVLYNLGMILEDPTNGLRNDPVPKRCTM